MRVEERREHLFEIVQKLPSAIRYSEIFDAPLRDLISAVRQHRLEGIVAKRAGSPYRSGERCNDWLKWRANRSQEFVVGGYVPNGSAVDSILVGYYETGELLYAGSLRAGLTPASRHMLLQHFEELRIPRCPFSIHLGSVAAKA
jgi:bifunctional non-homologous end joining protein LigD